MAHQSGYGGSITVNTGHAMMAIGVEQWSVNQTTMYHEAYAKGTVGGASEYVTVFPTVSEFEVSLTVLVQSDIPDVAGSIDELLAEGKLCDLHLKVNASDYLDAQACHISGHVTESPLDGPVRATITCTGTGTLLHVAA